MVNVIGVRFQNAGKLYFFDPGPFWPTPGDFVIVETARGVEFGEVVTGVRELSDEQLTAPLKQVVRIATAQDVQHAQDNQRNEKEAYAVCQRKIAEHKLDMKLVSVEYTFDNSKILFYFTANGRVDFRSLVKDLAAVFKTRIELRQIGVRDEAKMLGGLGPCGRPICCGAFLGDFQPVSIKMAKEQNLSLNPTKISGVCGRLMCCLKYEEENYEQTRKRMPKVGKEVITPDGNGVVWDLNVIKETVRVRIQKGDSSEIKDYPAADVQRVGMPAPVAAPVAAPRQDGDAAVPDAAPQTLDAAPALPVTDGDPAPEADAPAQAAAPAQGVPAAPQSAAVPQSPRGPQQPGRRGNRPPRQRPPRPDRPADGQSKPAEGRPAEQGKPADNARLAKPVMRENPNRRPGREGQAEQPPRGPKPAQGQPRQEQPTQGQPAQGQPRQEQPRAERRPRPDKPAAQEAAPAQKPAASAPSASPWKAAVEKALRAAQGDETPDKAAHAPISLEDHQDTYEFKGDSDDDVIL